MCMRKRGGASAPAKPMAGVPAPKLEWTCCECGALHDRDVNAARNIAILGLRHRPPLAGTLESCGGQARCLRAA